MYCPICQVNGMSLCSTQCACSCHGEPKELSCKCEAKHEVCRGEPNQCRYLYATHTTTPDELAKFKEMWIVSALGVSQ